jgi:hypothetical protein
MLVDGGGDGRGLGPRGDAAGGALRHEVQRGGCFT